MIKLGSGMRNAQSLWQKEQKEKKKKRNLIFIRLWIFIIGFLVLLSLFWKTYDTLRKSVWDGKNRINFVLSGDEVVLISFAPEEPSLALLPLPKGLQIDVIYGYGKYRVEAVSSLGELEKKDNLLPASLQENFGVPVEGWMISSSKFKVKSSKLKEEILDELKRQMWGRGKTNLNRWDLLRLWWGIRKLRPGDIGVLDLEKSNMILTVALPDKTTVFGVDFDQLDLKIQKFFGDSLLKKENLSIEVLNGTSHRGLAERAARLLTNIGGRVVWVGNSELQIANCRLQIEKNKKRAYTVKKISKIFNCQLEEKKEEGRAEITLTLGEDYWQKLNQR